MPSVLCPVHLVCAMSIVFMKVIECSLIARIGLVKLVSSPFGCPRNRYCDGTSSSSPSVISANCWFIDGEDRWRCISVNTEDCIGYRFTWCYLAANAVTYLLFNSTTLPGSLWVKDMSVWPLLLDLTLVRWRVEALVKATLFEIVALTWVRGVISTVSYFWCLPRLWYSCLWFCRLGSPWRFFWFLGASLA